MGVIVVKQQSTLTDYRFRNLYHTPKRLSREEQARNVRDYIESRRKENYGLEDMAAPPEELGRDMALYQGDDLELYENAADIIQDELGRSGLASQFRDYLDENIDAKRLPALRGYYSRQSTLPEHMWDMTTEGEHFDERGNIIPGAIPPVNAVKVIGSPGYVESGTAPNVSMREGYGLVPNIGSRENESYEDSLNLGSAFFPTKHGLGFVSPPYQEDMERHYAASVAGGEMHPNLFDVLNINPDARLVGIRGFGVPQDKAFARPAVGEGREGAYTAPIPPERLVGVFHRGKHDPEDFPRIEDELKHVLPTEKPSAFVPGYGSEVRDAISEVLPKIWEGRTFGLDNPAFSPAEKARIRAEIEERVDKKRDIAAEKVMQNSGLINARMAAIDESARRTEEGSFNPTKLYGFAGDKQ